MPGVNEKVLVRPEAVDPEAVRAEDVPTLVPGLLLRGQTNDEPACRLDALARRSTSVTLQPGRAFTRRRATVRQFRPAP